MIEPAGTTCIRFGPFTKQELAVFQGVREQTPLHKDPQAQKESQLIAHLAWLGDHLGDLHPITEDTFALEDTGAWQGIRHWHGGSFTRFLRLMGIGYDASDAAGWEEAWRPGMLAPLRRRGVRGEGYVLDARPQALIGARGGHKTDELITSWQQLQLPSLLDCGRDYLSSYAQHSRLLAKASHLADITWLAEIDEAPLGVFDEDRES